MPGATVTHGKKAHLVSARHVSDRRTAAASIRIVGVSAYHQDLQFFHTVTLLFWALYLYFTARTHVCQ
jgi:hypothetical protein